MYSDIENIFRVQMQSCAKRHGKIAVAFSGGGDSTALLLLMRDYVREQGGEVIALSVDHGLRPESAAEAASCAQIAATLGIPHRILRWEGEKPATRIQERARAARYNLLQVACRAEGVTTLALAHNLEDRLETFWMRLSGGSGLDGLAGLQSVAQRGDLMLLRPLLDIRRSDLRTYCQRHGVTWIEDPSNGNERYLRPRLRAFEEMLAEEGLTPARLSQTLSKLAQASDALRIIADQAFDAAVVCHAVGYVSLRPDLLANFPPDIRYRVFSKILHLFAPQDYPPSYEGVENLRQSVEAGDFTGATFYDCEVFTAGETVVFVREASAAEKPVLVSDGLRWDRHFVLSGKPAESVLIGMLGEAGVGLLRKDDISSLETLPHKVRKMLPTLWQGEKPVAVPCLSWFATGVSPNLRDLHIQAFSG